MAWCRVDRRKVAGKGAQFGAGKSSLSARGLSLLLLGITACSGSQDSKPNPDSSKIAARNEEADYRRLRDSVGRVFDAGITLDSVWASDSSNVMSRRLTIALQEILERARARQVVTLQLDDAWKSQDVLVLVGRKLKIGKQTWYLNLRCAPTIRASLPNQVNSLRADLGMGPVYLVVVDSVSLLLPSVGRYSSYADSSDDGDTDYVPPTHLSARCLVLVPANDSPALK
jgi:hypothetical protein